MEQGPAAAGELYYELHRAAGTADRRVILVGGLLDNVNLWDPLLPRLTAAGCDVVVYDARGMGRSAHVPSPILGATTQQYARDLVGVMTRVGWDRAHIVGFSLGGMVAMELCAMAAARIESLALVCTSRGGISAVPGVRGLARMLSVAVQRDTTTAVLASLELQHSASFLNRHPGSGVADPRETNRRLFFDATMIRFARDGPPSVQGTIAQTVAALRHRTSEEQLQGLRSMGFPVLVIVATDDVVCAPESGREIARIAGAALVELEGAGHHGVQEQPEAVVDALCANWGGTGDRGPVAKL